MSINIKEYAQRMGNAVDMGRRCTVTFASREYIGERWEIRDRNDTMTDEYKSREALRKSIADAPLLDGERIVHVRRYRIRKGKK